LSARGQVRRRRTGQSTGAWFGAMTVGMALSDDQVARYARHLILPEIGGAGQARLLSSKVLVVGAGGLGAPLVQYLAAAGVGYLQIVDDDSVDLSNLQRQVIHRTGDIGRPKVERAAEAALEINPGIVVEAHAWRLTPETADTLIAGVDVVADGSDNFDTRYLLNDACWRAGVPLVSAALLRFEGQMTVIDPRPGHRGPCYRCLFPERPPAGSVPSCAEAGVLGAMAGTMGCLQAVEVLKTLLDLGDRLVGRLLLHDALAMRFTDLAVESDPDCATCGGKAAAGG
ncbi:MAG: molybdopterin-synthase adenylyltransferase MoeB, partial [Azospirillaceae bacterium]